VVSTLWEKGLFEHPVDGISEFLHTSRIHLLGQHGDNQNTTTYDMTLQRSENLHASSNGNKITCGEQVKDREELGRGLSQRPVKFHSSISVAELLTIIKIYENPTC
jgi:hypothetical protein